MTFQRLLEDLFQHPDAVVASARAERQRLPGFRGALDDAGAAFRAGRVGVEPDPTDRGLLESENHRVEHPVGAEPDVGVAADVEARAEMIRVLLAHSAVSPV